MSRFEFRKDKTGLTAVGRKQLDVAKQQARTPKNEWQIRAEKNAKVKNANNNLKSYLIPLADEHESLARERFRAAEPRKKNMMTPEASFRDVGYTAGRIAYKGKFKGWYGSNYTPKIQSFGRISTDGSVLGALVDKKSYVLVAPRGYIWAVDNNGIMLTRVRDNAEYHIDSANIISGVAHCRRALLRALETRKVRDRANRERSKNWLAQNSGAVEQLKMYRKSKIKIAVSDSIGAGNCRAGTLTFCKMLGLDSSKTYELGAVVITVIKNFGKLSSFQIERFTRVLNILTLKSRKAA